MTRSQENSISLAVRKLPFDEVIVTTFTADTRTVSATLPILGAYYLTREGEHTGGAGK